MCHFSDSRENPDKFIIAWEARFENREMAPIGGYLADYATQKENSIELNGLRKTPRRVYARCIVARLHEENEYYSEYFEIGPECDLSEFLLKIS